MTVTLDLTRLFTAFLGLLCGAGLYLALVNRVLSHLRDGLLKSTFLPLSFIACLGGLTFFGYLAGTSAWILPLAALLGWMAAAEWRYRRMDRLLRSDPPVTSQGRQISLRRPLTTYDLQVLHYNTRLHGWKGQPVRVAHLSDLHLHAGSSLSFFQDAIQQVNAGCPDLIFITGDFVADQAGLDILPEVLLPLSCRLGKFAILGNHDTWTDSHKVSVILGQVDFNLLDAGTVQVLQDGDRKMAISGCAAPWSRQNCQFESVPAGIPHLALSHTADHIYALSQVRAAAVFSGHYHAGQMQLPFFGPLVVPSRYGRRFHKGHFKVGHTHLFVSAGLGASHPQLRIYCPPDIVFVDFSEDPSADSGKQAIQ